MVYEGEDVSTLESNNQHPAVALTLAPLPASQASLYSPPETCPSTLGTPSAHPGELGGTGAAWLRVGCDSWSFDRKPRVTKAFADSGARHRECTAVDGEVHHVSARLFLLEGLVRRGDPGDRRPARAVLRNLQPALRDDGRRLGVDTGPGHLPRPEHPRRAPLLGGGGAPRGDRVPGAREAPRPTCRVHGATGEAAAPPADTARALLSPELVAGAHPRHGQGLVDLDERVGRQSGRSRAVSGGMTRRPSHLPSGGIGIMPGEGAGQQEREAARAAATQAGDGAAPVSGGGVTCSWWIFTSLVSWTKSAPMTKVITETTMGYQSP